MKLEQRKFYQDHVKQLIKANVKSIIQGTKDNEVEYVKDWEGNVERLVSQLIDQWEQVATKGDA